LKEGNYKSINVNFGQAATETSLLLPYEQEQKIMEGQTYYNNVLCRQHENGGSCCWSGGVFFFFRGAEAQSGPWFPHS